MIVPVKGVAAMGIDLSDIGVGEVALLVPEPENSHDAHAIRVEVRGRLVGYLDRHLAARINAADYRATVGAVLPHPETGKPAGLRLDLRLLRVDLRLRRDWAL